MHIPAYQWAGGLVALYLLWLGLWIVFGDQAFGLNFYNWDQAVAALVSAGSAMTIARHQAPPIRLFLLLLGLSLIGLSFSWITYDPGHAHPEFHFTSDNLPDYASVSYAFFAFLAACAWGYLAIEYWRRHPPTVLTRVVFALLFIGLLAVLANFYYPQYRNQVDTEAGRLDAVCSALEFIILFLGLICILLRQSIAMTMTVMATALILASDLAYSDYDVPKGIEAVWMFGQLFMLAAFWTFPTSQQKILTVEPTEKRRSGLSGILILLSLGGLLLAVALSLIQIHRVWKSFYGILFIVVIVITIVWLTNRFDDAVCYLKEHAQRLMRNRLRRLGLNEIEGKLKATLMSTGLDIFLIDLETAAEKIQHDVIFLGPERLFPYSASADSNKAKTCFLVMPFSFPWSDDVHKVLVNACKDLSIVPVRGDDLFTPTDILNDIWKSLNAADFIIADITGRNPNVFYELGIAHALAKPVLIISRNASDIPIDLSTRRIIVYGQNEETWQTDLSRKVSHAISEIIRVYGLQTNA